MFKLAEFLQRSPRHVSNSAVARWSAARSNMSRVAGVDTSRADYLRTFDANRNLSNLEYRSRRESVSSFPYRWFVSMAERCNLRCVMCRASQDPHVFSNTLPDHLYENIDLLLPYVGTFHIFGAEPFFAFNHGRIRPLVRRTEDFVNIKFSGTTNGQLLDREKAGFCLEHFSDIRISIDSPDPDVYESIRVNGRFDVLMRNVEYLRDLKARNGRAIDEAPVMKVNYLVMDRTYRDIVRFVDVAHELGIHEVRFSPVRVNFDPSMSSEDIFTDPDKTDEFSMLLTEAKRRAESCDITIIDTPVNRVAELRQRLGAQAPMPDVKVPTPTRKRVDRGSLPVCNEPWGSLWIHQDGQAQFCLGSSAIGDVTTSTITEIYNGERAREIRRQFLQGDYSACHPHRCPRGGLAQFGSCTGRLPENGRTELERLSGLPAFRDTKLREKQVGFVVRRVNRLARWWTRIRQRVCTKVVGRVRSAVSSATLIAPTGASLRDRRHRIRTRNDETR